MRLSVIGCGYLGAVHSASMAELGHEVVGVDVDPVKVQALSEGRAPFFEPDLPEILSSAGRRGVCRSRPRWRRSRAHGCTSSRWGRRSRGVRTPPI